MADIRLIATDLDGTLMGSANEFPLYTSFRDLINKLRAENNAVWAICTGRRMSSFKSFFAPMMIMGIAPDFVIVNHAYIYSVVGSRYTPHLLWNWRIRYLLWINYLSDRQVINECYKKIAATSLVTRTILRKKDRLWVRCSSVESTSIVANLLRKKTKHYRHMTVFTYQTEVDLMSIPFAKGLAVSELARHIGVHSESILAVGDGHNDMSMLSKNVAGLTGCPANAVSEVMEAVHRSNGHIASEKSLAGVIDVLRSYTAGTVCGDLPEGWKDRALMHRKRPDRSSRSRHRSSRKSVVNPWIFAATIYAVLLVFANFNLIPFVSGIIMTPFRLLVSLMLKVIGIFS